MKTTTHIKYLDGTVKTYNGAPKNIKVFDKRAENAKTIEISTYYGSNFFKKDDNGIWATAINQTLEGKYWRFILVPKEINYKIKHESIDNETASAIIERETEELMGKARAAVEWCDPKDEEDEKGRYWLSLYHGAINYLLIVKGGRIRGAIAEGYEAVRREVFTCEQSFWNAVYRVIEEKLGPEFHLLQAEGSGSYFYLNDETDEKYLPTENYAVPTENGGLHNNTEVKSIKKQTILKRYIIEITLSDGDKVAAKVTAASPQNALKRLKASLAYMIDKNDETGRFFKDKDIESIDIVGVETINDDVSNIIIQRLPGSDMYVVSEEGGSALTFYEGRYKSTVEVLPPGETVTAEDIAASVRRIGEWLAINYPELL